MYRWPGRYFGSSIFYIPKKNTPTNIKDVTHKSRNHINDGSRRKSFSQWDFTSKHPIFPLRTRAFKIPAFQTSAQFINKSGVSENRCTNNFHLDRTDLIKCRCYLGGRHVENGGTFIIALLPILWLNCRERERRNQSRYKENIITVVSVRIPNKVVRVASLLERFMISERLKLLKPQSFSICGVGKLPESKEYEYK